MLVLDKDNNDPINSIVYSLQELGKMSGDSLEKYLRSVSANKVAFSEGSISKPEHVDALNSYLESGIAVRSFTLNGAFAGRAKGSFKKLMNRLLTKQYKNLRELSLQNEISVDEVICKHINAWLKSREGLVFKFTGTLSEENFNFMFSDIENNFNFTCLKLGVVTIRENFFVNLSSLTELSLNNTDMNDNVWKEFCDFITLNKKLKSFTMARILHNKTHRAQHLGEVLGKNQHLKSMQIIHERPMVVADLIGHIKDNDSLEHFSYNPLHHKEDKLDDVLSALTSLVKDTQARLCSIDIAGAIVSTELVSLLNKNMLILYPNVEHGMDNVINQLNKDTPILSLGFKSLVYGAGSKLFFALLPRNSTTKNIDINLRVTASYDSLLLKEQDLVSKEGKNMITARQFFPVDVCSSGQQNAYSLLSTFSLRQTNKGNPRASIKRDKLIEYFSQNGIDVGCDVNLAKQVTKVNNCWFGVNSTDIGTPVVRSEHEGEVCFVTFMLAELLSSGYSREMKKITSMVAKVLDSQTVHIVGIIEKNVIDSITKSLGIDLLSLKSFLSQELMGMLPIELHRRIAKREFYDKNEGTQASNAIFFIDTPFDNTFTDDQTALWRSIQKRLVKKEVISRWYVLLGMLKRNRYYIWYQDALDIALNLMGVEKEYQAHDLKEMMTHFETSGELVIIHGSKEILVVLDKSWLKRQMDALCSEKINVENLWPGENKEIQVMLREYAEENGLLFEIGAKKTCFFPYVVPEHSKTKDSSAKTQNVKAKDLPCLFSICIPRYHVNLEFFNIFCGNLLKCSIDGERSLDESSFIRKSDYLEFSFNKNTKVWAMCDSLKRRIQLGFIEENFSELKEYVKTCRNALSNTISFFTPQLGDKKLFDINEEDTRTIEYYCHLLLHFVVDDEIMKVPYEAFLSEGAPIEFGLFKLPVRTIEQIDFVQTAKELASTKSIEREITDVLIMSSASKGPHPDLKDFLGCLLEHKGYRVEFGIFSEGSFPEVKSKILLMFLGEEITTSLENEGKIWKRRAQFKGWPMKRCFFAVSSTDLILRCNYLFLGCRSLFGDNMTKTLKLLLTEVGQKVDEAEWSS